jgi:Alpha/beta hydrolase of unknown function (DUF1400)
MRLQLAALGGAFLFTLVGAALSNSRAIAAEQVVLKYNILERAISVDELSRFAETGELSPELQAYLNLAQRDPDDVRQTLNQETGVNVRLLDTVLNSPVGNLALDQITQAIYTPSREADNAAMRSALILSASGDSRISLIEVIQNYPTQQVYVDGNRLVDAYQQVSALGDRLGNLLEGTGLF